MNNPGGRTERLLPARSVWTTSMIWWHIGFYSVLASLAYLAVLDQPLKPGTPLVVAALALLAVVYPFLTRTRDLRTNRPVFYVAVLVTVVVFLSFVHDGSGALLFVAFPQVWMFTASQRQGVAATAVLCLGVAAGQVSRYGLGGTEVFGITAQLVTSFAVSCMIGVWISKVIEQSEQRAELLAELEAARTDLNAAEQARGALLERERMAREIHDTLAQGFTSIAMLSEAAQAQLRKDGVPDLLESLGVISRTARENLAEARSLVASGVATNVRGGDLLAALKRLPVSLHLEDIQVQVDVPATLPPLSSSEQVALLRTAQEALNNVRRHSGASMARLEVQALAGPEAPGLRLAVGDDGHGFDTAASHDGFGLKSMAARLAEIGGRLHLESSTAGTTLTAVVPVSLPGPNRSGTDRQKESAT